MMSLEVYYGVKALRDIVDGVQQIVLDYNSSKKGLNINEIMERLTKLTSLDPANENWTVEQVMSNTSGEPNDA